MPTPPLFFLPFLPPELAEASYAHMAEKCDKIAPGPRGRVYSISFAHERVVWVATVGKRPKGLQAKVLEPGEVDQKTPQWSLPSFRVALSPSSQMPCIPPAPTSRYLLRTLWRSEIFSVPTFLRKEIVSPRITRFTSRLVYVSLAFQRYRAAPHRSQSSVRTT